MKRNEIENLECFAQNIEAGKLYVVEEDISLEDSNFGNHLILKLAVDMLYPVMCFALAHSSVKKANRFLLIQSGLPEEKVMDEQLMTPTDWKAYEDAASLLYGKPIYIDDTIPFNLATVSSKLEECHAEYQLKVVLIDGLTNEDREAHPECFHVLESLAQKLGIGIVVVTDYIQIAPSLAGLSN